MRARPGLTGGVTMAAMLLGVLVPSSLGEPPSDDLRAMVEADWAAQESRRGRTPDAPAAIRDALSRGERLLAHLRQMDDGPDVSGAAADLAHLRRRAEEAAALDAETRLALYREIRWCFRRAALAKQRRGEAVPVPADPAAPAPVSMDLFGAPAK